MIKSRKWLALGLGLLLGAGMTIGAAAAEPVEMTPWVNG